MKHGMFRATLPTLASFVFLFQPTNSLGRSYTQVQTALETIASRYPANARIVEVGASDSGSTVRGLSIGNGPQRNLIVATHHGNEYGSTEVALGFARAIAENPIHNQTVYVVPVLNIEGYNHGSRWETGSGVSRDPNRDYPGPCGGEGPFHLRSTRGLAEFVEREQIVSSATLHTFYPAVVYPWGFGTRDISTPYDDLYKHLTQLATALSRYATGNSGEVIYPANGTFEDYAFWKHGIWSLLFELGRSHSPSDADVAEMVRVNTPGLRRFLEEAPVSRASDHAFRGRCDARLAALDRHDE